GASDPPSSAVSRTAPDERRESGSPRAAHGAMARWPYLGHLARVRRLAGIRSFHTWLRASASGSTHCRSATLGYTLCDSYATVVFPVPQGPRRPFCDRSASWGIPQRDAAASSCLKYGCERSVAEFWRLL